MRKQISKIQKLEPKLDRYNHIMELIRTLVPLVILVVQVVILIKLFS
jgi:hypothetical protein